MKKQYMAMTISLALTMSLLIGSAANLSAFENIECGDDRPIILASPYTVRVARNGRTTGEVIDQTKKWLEDRYAAFADCYEECNVPEACTAYSSLNALSVTALGVLGTDFVDVIYNAGTVKYGCTDC